MSNLLPFSVIIPAAGNSGRMGSDKALLKLADGKTFAENLLSNIEYLALSFFRRPILRIYS